MDLLTKAVPIINDPKVLVMIVVVAVVGLLILMPMARVLGTPGAKAPA